MPGGGEGRAAGRAGRLVVIFGPPAVGKMAVGMELAKLTGLPLFHNHMVIEPLLALFEFGSPPYRRLVREFRRRVFEEVAASDLPGLIFTYVWDLDATPDGAFIEGLCDIFRERGADVVFVELFAPLEVRLERNRTALRLAEKASKRDIDASDARVREAHAKYRLNTDGEFFHPDSYLRLDNTELSAEEAARRVAAFLDRRDAAAD